MKFLMEETFNWVRRNLIIIILVAIALYYVALPGRFITMLMYIAITEAFALILSVGVQKAYTAINFEKQQTQTLGQIIIAVHVLVSLFILAYLFQPTLTP